MTVRRGTLTIHRTRFLEDEIMDGDYLGGEHTTTDTQEFDGSASEVARIIRNAGLDFAATGSDWAANPDGSYISNYATGERVAESAHLGDGWPARVVDAIVSAVDR